MLDITKNRYRLYIDETGNHHKSVEKPGNRYLGLLGCVIQRGSYESSFEPCLLGIKREFFSDDHDTPILLHTEDIKKRSGHFQSLKDSDRRLLFNKAMISFYRDQAYTLIAVVLDKMQYFQKSSSNHRHPYNYCAEAMLERYYFFLNEAKGVGDVLVESRGNKEDRKLQNEWKMFFDHGTRFVSHRKIRRHLSDGNIIFRKKTDNISGLQLADLLARTCTRDVLISYERETKYRSAFDERMADAVSTKYRRNPESLCPKGYGKVMLK